MGDATLAAVSRPRRLVVVLVALALVTVGVAACGSSNSSSSASSDATNVLKQTFGRNKPVKSGFLDVKLDFSGQGLKSLQGPLAFRLTGPFQSQGKNKLPKFDLSLNVSASGQTLNAGAVSTGDKGFLKLQGKTYALPAQLFSQFLKGYAQSSAKSGSSGAPTLHSLGVDPLRWLEHPTNKGEQDVAGTPTVRIGAGISVGNLLDDISKLLGKASSLGLGSTGIVPTSLSPKVKQAIERSVKSASVDVYSGKSDNILRRLTLDVKLDVPKDLQSSTAGLRNGELAVDLTIADLNKPQTVKAPANARPLSELTSALGGLLGGATGSGSGSSGAPSSGTSSKYLQCLQRAGRDIAKVQRCASLIGSG
jgi:hypothetical protein